MTETYSNLPHQVAEAMAKQCEILASIAALLQQLVEKLDAVIVTDERGYRSVATVELEPD